MTRGQVWTLVRGSQQYRVLIISNDEFNSVEAVAPWALIVQRDVALPELGVQLGPVDPLRGTVDVTAVVRVDRSALRDNLGFVSNDTMNAVEQGLREFLVLP